MAKTIILSSLLLGISSLARCVPAPYPDPVPLPFSSVPGSVCYAYESSGTCQGIGSCSSPGIVLDSDDCDLTILEVRKDIKSSPTDYSLTLYPSAAKTPLS